MERSGGGAGARRREAQLRFVKDGQPVNMRFRIDEMKPNEGVRWTCTAHDMPSWIGTTLNWGLAESDGGVVVSLEHAGFGRMQPRSRWPRAGSTSSEA